MKKEKNQQICRHLKGKHESRAQNSEQQTHGALSCEDYIRTPTAGHVREKTWLESALTQSKEGVSTALDLTCHIGLAAIVPLTPWRGGGL